MNPCIQEKVDVVQRDGETLYVVTKASLSSSEIISLNRWLESEGFTSDVKKLSILNRNHSLQFTPPTFPLRVKVLLMAYLVAWPIISLIVAILLFSR